MQKMNAGKETKDLAVAILVSEIALAKTISDSLRSFGIFGFYYQSLEDFWVAVNAQTPDLCIVDLSCMNDGSMHFRSHPKVKSGELQFAFTYSSSLRHLLAQTEGLNYTGLINYEMDLNIQMGHLLRSILGQMALIEQNKMLSEQTKKLREKGQRILNDAQMGQYFEKQVNVMTNMMTRMGEMKTKPDFIGALADMFSEFNHCRQFGIYEISPSGEGLTSPAIQRPKFRLLPDLWTSSPAKNGMDEYAEELICEVSFDFFGKDLRLIKIAGHNHAPAMIVVASFDEEALVGFPWNLLEIQLSYAFRGILLSEREDSSDEVLWNIWETCSFLDDMQFHQVKSPFKPISISLAPMLEMVRVKHSNRFFWKAFYKDFTSSLERVLKGKYKLSYDGVHEFILLLDTVDLEFNYGRLKAFVEEFPFWRYFSDSGILMGKNMAPAIKFIAPSAVNLLRNHYKDQELAAKETSIRREAEINRTV